MAVWFANAALAVLVLSNAVVADCLDRVILRPYGTIMPDDAVSLQIPIHTSSTPVILFQPTEVRIIGSEVIVDLYIASGELMSPDFMVEWVELGTFAPGTHDYKVVQNTADPPPHYYNCPAQEIAGTFCVDDPDCTEDECRCPEQRATYLIISLGTLGGRYSYAYGMNDLAQVVGMSYRADWTQVAFLWEDGVMTDLGFL